MFLVKVYPILELESVINVAFHHFTAFDWCLHINNSFYRRSDLLRNGDLSMHNVLTKNEIFSAQLKIGETVLATFCVQTFVVSLEKPKLDFARQRRKWNEKNCSLSKRN